MQDHYQTLGISPSATSGQIKIAYRRLALKYHPDRNPGDSNAENHFIAVTEAYEVLSDPVKRHKYDHGISFDDDDFAPDYTQRRPPPQYYYKYKPEKIVYSRKDYALAYTAVGIMIIVAVVLPLYLLQLTSTKYYSLAVDNYFQGKYYSALHNIDLSIKDMSSHNDEACALASVILVHRLQKYDYALRYIERGLGYHPNDSLASELHYLKGICHAKLSEPQAALNEFSLVKNYSTAYDSSLFRSAVILIFNQHNLDSAQSIIDQLLSRNHDNYSAEYLKGIVYEQKSEPHHAYEVFSNLINKPFNKAAVYFHLAQSEIKLNLTDSACAHLQIASDFRLLEAQQLLALYCLEESI
jgi:curved DNA-binding protein CbpA